MTGLRVLLAPDSFKESLGAMEVCRALERGLQAAAAPINVKKLPLADGGDGTVPALLHSVGGETETVKVTGPLGEKVQAEYGVLSDGTAVMEMASASGLWLVPPDKRNPMHTTTYGSGELLAAIARRGHSRVIMGVGGSATVDGGVGALQALGAVFYDADGNPLPHVPGIVTRVAALDVSNVVQEVRELDLVVACDVENPLAGPNGAAPVFGPQKGAEAQQVELLSSALERLGELLEKHCGCPVLELAGAGAAGGLSAALHAVVGAELAPGIEVVLEAVNFDDELRHVDLVITGEGKFDSQTGSGKVAAGVARHSRQAGKPAVVVAGVVDPQAASELLPGIRAVVPIQRGPMSLQASMDEAVELLEETGRRIGRLLELGSELNRNTQ